MDLAHVAVGQLVSVDGMRFRPSATLELVIHPLHVGGGNEGDLLVAKVGLDVKAHGGFVRLPRAFTDGEEHILVQPLVEPFSKRHLAVLGQLHTAVILDALMKLIEHLLLRFAVDVTVDRLAVILVTDDDPRFPLTTLLLTNHSVACRTFLWHQHHLSFSTTLYHNFFTSPERIGRKNLIFIIRPPHPQRTSDPSVPRNRSFP